MQSSNGKAGAGTATPLPELGQNKILQAANDYVHMEAELASIKASLAQHVDISNKLMAENEAMKNQLKVQAEFLTRQFDLVTAHRDRLQVALRGLMTRFKVIRECFIQCETEALTEGLAANQPQPAGEPDGDGREIPALQDIPASGTAKRLAPPSYPVPH